MPTQLSLLSETFVSGYRTPRGLIVCDGRFCARFGHFSVHFPSDQCRICSSSSWCSTSGVHFRVSSSTWIAHHTICSPLTQTSTSLVWTLNSFQNVPVYRAARLLLYLTSEFSPGLFHDISPASALLEPCCLSELR